MGVLGLTPFLQKICPEVIKQLPNRLRGFEGKTIVIDGTLITQRLHYAQLPHHYRHVLGWYKLVKEIKDSGAKAICVFDGKERSRAKAAEVARRKEVQRMSVVRGSIESKRSTRLQRLLGLLHDLRALKASEQERVTDLIPKAVSDILNLNTPPLYPKELLRSLPVQHPIDDQDYSEHQASQLLKARSDAMPVQDGILLRDLVKEGVDSSARFDVDVPLSTYEPVPSNKNEYLSSEINIDSGFSVHDQIVAANYISDHPIDKGLANDSLQDNPALVNGTAIEDASQIFDSSTVLEDPGSDMNQGGEWRLVRASQTSLDNIPTALASLYVDYLDSIPTFTSLFNSQSVPPLPSISPPEIGVSDTPTEYSMSKQQLRLALDEGNIWKDITTATSASILHEGDHDHTTIENMLSNLARESSIMSESFQRRTNPPTLQTYIECKEILQAMGVPCLDVAGAFEAEALAASLVLNGLADYVASEDTDVLAYEAPLMRNISNRQGPLVIVSGSEIRDVLQLDRASFIDFVLLLGTDFSPRIKNVGPMRALKFIREHGSIERVLENETKYPPRLPTQAYLHQVEVARLVFQTLPPVPDQDLLVSKGVDDDKVAEILLRYNLIKAAMYDWDYGASLDGNYFGDDPTAFFGQDMELFPRQLA